MSNKPSIPKGTRDFSPTEMARRNYIFDTIKKVYKKYGFQQIETPAMENLETLIGTGGDESDTLIFKILDSGDYLPKSKEKITRDIPAYIDLHIYNSLKILFDAYINSEESDFTNDVLLDLIKSNIVDEKSGFHMYENRVDLLKITSEFYQNNVTHFRNIFLDIKNQVKDDSREFYFEQYYRGTFLQNELYQSLLNIISNEINENSDYYEVKSNYYTKYIAEKALHYDLTVPFARYVVQNQNDITFPFRRFQIQPVWRADRPQKGRYREFYQCDADIIGSDSLLNEVDLIKIIDDVFSELFQGKLNYTVSINNRKILQGIVESIGQTDKFEQIVVAIDKFDKIGVDGVVSELYNLGFNEKTGEKLLALIGVQDESNKLRDDDIPIKGYEFIKVQLEFIEKHIANTINGEKGIEELEFLFEKLKMLKVNPSSIKFDPTLARGLGYYTGTIIEVKVADFPSICGGGRYDDLTGKFGLKDVSGVGISFGADRIYDVLLDNNLYPEFKGDSTQVLFINFGEKEQDYCLPLLFKLRDAGINSEIYPEAGAKMKKQMTFANNKNIKYVVLVGSDEMESGKLTVKNMESGEQQSLTIEDLITLIQK